MRRAIRRAPQLMNRAASKAPIRYSAIGTPRSRTQTPMLPAQKPCHRSSKLTASTGLFVISPVAPPDSRFEEPVDVSVQNGRWIADFVVGAQVLHHLVRSKTGGPHLVAPT